MSDRLGDEHCWLLVRGSSADWGTLLSLEASVALDGASVTGSARSVHFRPSPEFWAHFDSFRSLARDELEVHRLFDGCLLHLKRDSHGALQIKYRIADEQADPDLALTGAVHIHGEFREQALATLERALRGASSA